MAGRAPVAELVLFRGGLFLMESGRSPVGNPHLVAAMLASGGSPHAGDYARLVASGVRVPEFHLPLPPSAVSELGSSPRSVLEGDAGIAGALWCCLPLPRRVRSHDAVARAVAAGDSARLRQFARAVAADRTGCDRRIVYVRYESLAGLAPPVLPKTYPPPGRPSARDSL